MKFVKDNKWCTNCLHPSHTCSQCTSSFTCRTCKGKHHTLLHKDGSSSPQLNLVATTTKTGSKTQQPSVQPPTHGFLNTAIIELTNGNRTIQIRAALDTGASTSIVTEKVVTHLQLSRSSHNVIVHGANGDSTSKHFVTSTVRSTFNPENKRDLKMSVVSKLPPANSPPNPEEILNNEMLKGLEMADKKLGGQLDMIIGILDTAACILPEAPKHCPNTGIIATPTLFGWTISGPLKSNTSVTQLKIELEETTLDQQLELLWELDKTAEIFLLPSQDSATKQFKETVTINEDGRYIVKLPRVDDPPSLGSSRKMAVSRSIQNERSLKKKNKLKDFNCALSEYLTLEHAEVVSQDELHKPSYYLPVHGVFKQSSTTTKVRPVFDGSAKTTSGFSLNDTLLPGPNLYPLIMDILIKFRNYQIAFSADIGKMFREISLHPDDRDLHRFLLRAESGKLVECRMRRLTFGIKSSPFLATSVLLDLADKHQLSHPLAHKAIHSAFYVDDLLSGAASVREAVKLREEICDLLSRARMTLRKWRTNNDQFRDTIPQELIETEDLHLPVFSDAPKALGVHWDVGKDNLHISTPSSINKEKTVTKRVVASQSAQVYDVLGMFAPFTITSKIILRSLWKRNIQWDATIPEDLEKLWITWRDQLPIITQHPISRRYNTKDSPISTTTLHGFADASQIAYGAVVYVRHTHQDGTISTAVVYSKARVCPTKNEKTIPKLELVAAYLLAKLLVYVAQHLQISLSNIYSWSDSEIVIAENALYTQTICCQSSGGNTRTSSRCNLATCLHPLQPC